MRNLYNWSVYRRCLCPRVGVGSCGTAVAPRSTILPTWATPGPSFLLTSCGESYRTISIMRSSIAWTSQILTTRCVDTDIDDLQGISGRETENAQQILLNVVLFLTLKYLEILSVCFITKLIFGNLWEVSWSRII